MTADSPRPVTTTAPTADLQPSLQPATTAADQVFDLTDSAGSLRSQAKGLHEDTSALHQSALVQEWQRLTTLRARSAPRALLQELADLGFGWRDIARMLRVSVPAVQKWRRNGGVSGPHRRAIASLLALCDLVRERYMIQEIASWFEMPISAEAPVTPINLYAEERISLLLDYASGQGSNPEQLLNDYDPAWRERFPSDFEAYQEADGNMSIRPRNE
jgi:hypothetical protein